MDWGARSTWLEKIAEETGRPVPALDSKPEVPEDLLWVWEAWWHLAGSRPSSGFGPLPIPISEILAYCEFLGFRSLDNRAFLLRIVRVLDEEYFTILEARKNSKVEFKGRKANKSESMH